MWILQPEEGAAGPTGADEPPAASARAARRRPPGAAGATPRRSASGSGRVGEAAGTVPRPGAAAGPAGPDLPEEIVAELVGAVGKDTAPRLADRLAAAAGAYERDRYHDALRITRQLVDLVPESATVRELHGLVCYRLGRWREAARHLTAATELGGEDVDQLPVLMDCARAQGHHRRVAELWDRLRQASPPADVLVEGRLVLVSSMAERGDLGGAIAILAGAGAGRDLRHPGERHVRQWYVLADLCERAGDLPRARQLFARVVEADPDTADAAARLAALGPPPPRPARDAGRGTVVTLGQLARGGRSAARRAR